MLFNTLIAVQLLAALRVAIAAPANYDGESMLNAREPSSLGHQEYTRDLDLEALSARDISVLGARADNISPDLVGRAGRRSCTPPDKKEKERAKKELEKAKKELEKAKKELEKAKKELEKAKKDLKKAKEELKANKDDKRKRYFEQKVYDGNEAVARENDNIEYWQSCIS
jgi:exonuclease VII small subunit